MPILADTCMETQIRREADVGLGARGKRVHRITQWRHMAEENEEDEGEIERGSTAEEETLCRK